MSRCPNCQRPVDRGDRVCEFCDEPLNKGQTTPDTSQPERGQQQSAGGKKSQTDRSADTGPTRTRGERTQGNKTDSSGQQSTGGTAQATTSTRAKQQKQSSGDKETPHEWGWFDFILKYPKRDGWMPVIKTVVLTLPGALLVVPLFIASGYGFRLARSAALGWHNPPKYDDWSGLFVDGIRFSALIFIASFVMNIISFALFTVALNSSPILAALLFPVVAVVVPWVVYSILLAFIGSNSVIKAFTNGEALNILQSLFYLKSVFLFFILNFVFLFWTIITFPTVVIPVGLSSYIILSTGAHWGYVYYRAVEKGIVSAPVKTGQATARQTTQQSQQAGQLR